VVGNFSVCNLLCSLFIFYFSHFILFHLIILFCLLLYFFILLVVVNYNLYYACVFSSYGKGCSSESVQAVDRFLTPTPLRNSHPTESAKGCRGAARDILVVALAGHNMRLPLVFKGVKM